MLSKGELYDITKTWFIYWNNHDLESVLNIFTDDIIFENWFDRNLQGKDILRRAWKNWFREDDFEFIIDEIFTDEIKQTSVVLWTYKGSILDSRYKNSIETRKGLDIIYFRDKKIFLKQTYTKSKIILDGKDIRLTPENINF